MAEYGFEVYNSAAYLDAGGEAPNIVQDHASLLYFIRAPKMSDCDAISPRIKKIAQGAALMTETDVNIKVFGGLHDNLPNPTASRILSDAFVAEGGPDFTEEEFAIARACAEVWENPEAVNTAKEELLEATGGVYVSPIPDGIEPGDGM